MHGSEVIDRLNRLADELFSPEEPRFSGLDRPPFEITRNARHQSKAEFEADLKSVQSILGHLDSILDALGEHSEGDAGFVVRTRTAVDHAIRNYTKRGKSRNGTSRDLAVQNIRDTGFFEGSRELLEDMRMAYRLIVNDLKSQEALFWSAPHRPPDHFARLIALRFARLYRQKTGKMPTFGTSSQGGHPSTDFSRGLERVFEILAIKTKMRSPAEWALQHLKDEIRRTNAPQPMGADPKYFTSGVIKAPTPTDQGKS